MPRFNLSQPKASRAKRLDFDWEDFSGGLNTLFKDSELGDNELAQAQNLQFTGKGIPTKAPGTQKFFMSGLTGVVRGMSGFYQKDGTVQMLSITDAGFLNIKSNASYARQAGASWTSGNDVEMAQLDDKMYIVNGQRELTRYGNPTLVGFATIAQPSGVFATQFSGASGTNTVSYRLTHITKVGETLPSDAFLLKNQPQTLDLGAVQLSWANASSASQIRTGTNIYGRVDGTEAWLAQVDADATEWIDDGSSVESLFAFSPISDSTGGIIAKQVVRFQDRLIFSGIPNDPTIVFISGRVPNHERFDFGSGGGFIRIEPDSGDDVVGLSTKGDKIIVFKQRSVWEVSLNLIEFGGFFLLEPVAKLITGSIGAAGQRSISNVENDIFFLSSSGRGVFVLGNEPGILGDILRTNEVSVKIRPFFESLTASEESGAAAVYFDNKYRISVPGKTQTMVFDRERSAWSGPWSFDGRISNVFYDTEDAPHLLIGENDSTDIDEISDSFSGHKGVAMNTILRTKREDFGDWSRFDNIKSIFTRWRNLSGEIDVSIRLEGRKGNTLTSKSFSVTTGAGNSGWGADVWANTQWGDTEVAGEAVDLAEVIKDANIQKTARNIQLIIRTDALNDNYELMAVRGEANRLGNFRPISWRV